MEVVATTIRRAKLHSNHHHQQTNTQLFTGRMPFLSPNQQGNSSVRAEKAITNGSNTDKTFNSRTAEDVKVARVWSSARLQESNHTAGAAEGKEK